MGKIIYILRWLHTLFIVGGLVPNLEFSRENVKNICKIKYNSVFSRVANLALFKPDFTILASFSCAWLRKILFGLSLLSGLFWLLFIKWS